MLEPGHRLTVLGTSGLPVSLLELWVALPAHQGGDRDAGAAGSFLLVLLRDQAGDGRLHLVGEFRAVPLHLVSAAIICPPRWCSHRQFFALGDLLHNSPCFSSDFGVMNVIAAVITARGEHTNMKHFTIDAENNITVHSSKKAAREAGATSFRPRSSSPT